MHIVKVEHDRCNEYDETKYYVVPDSMDVGTALEEIHKAQAEYLGVVEKNRGLNKPAPIGHFAKDFPDGMTVAEIKQKQADYEKAIAAYEKAMKEQNGSFDTHLAAHGIVPLWKYEGDELVTTSLDWGHRHGYNLSY